MNSTIRTTANTVARHQGASLLSIDTNAALSLARRGFIGLSASKTSRAASYRAGRETDLSLGHESWLEIAGLDRGQALEQLARGLFISAAVVAGYLAVITNNPSFSILPELFASSFSHVLGLPTAMLGMPVYLLAAFMLPYATQRENGLRAVMARSLHWLILMSTLWFAFLQLFAFHALDPLCCIAHGLACIGVVITWKSLSQVTRWHWGAALPLATAAIVAFIGLQAITYRPLSAPPLHAFEPTEEESGLALPLPPIAKQ